MTVDKFWDVICVCDLQLDWLSAWDTYELVDLSFDRLTLSRHNLSLCNDDMILTAVFFVPGCILPRTRTSHAPSVLARSFIKPAPRRHRPSCTVEWRLNRAVIDVEFYEWGRVVVVVVVVVDLNGMKRWVNVNDCAAPLGWTWDVRLLNRCRCLECCRCCELPCWCRPTALQTDSLNLYSYIHRHRWRAEILCRLQPIHCVPS